MSVTSDSFVDFIMKIKSNLETCIMGKDKEITLLLIALFGGGHVLLEDVPGTGKTMLVKSLAKSIHGEFRRIQCNPDLLPTDITGVSIYHPKQETFLFRPGPIMTHILLVDEINRATTKTQSALLEAMEEHHVTVDGQIHELPNPFLLLATQNPIDFEGTYQLPEAQLDRFMMKFSLGYPDKDTEMKMLASQVSHNPLDDISAVVNVEDILVICRKVREIFLSRQVSNYLVDITRLTREHKGLYLGASPRGTLALMHASKAYAFLQGRDYVLPDDVKWLVPYVLGHRIILNTEARMEGATVDSVLAKIMEQIPVPVRLENPR